MDFDFSQEHILENDRVRLAPVTLFDEPALYNAGMQDKKLTQFSTYAVYETGLVRDFIKQAEADRKEKFRYAFSIFDKQTNQFAGSTSFANISNHDKRLEIGWTWLGPSFQKTGLNRNCKFLLLEYVFETLEFERVELRTDERNLKSRTAIEGIGAKLEGKLRNHTLMPDGFRRSTLVYSILKQEWPTVKHNLEIKLDYLPVD